MTFSVYTNNARLNKLAGRCLYRNTHLLNETLTALLLSPCQDTDALQSQLDRVKTTALNVTERSVARCIDQDAQREEYSGKTKDHTAPASRL